MKYALVDDEVEFRLGGQVDGMDIVFTELGLERLVLQGKQALRELRASHVAVDG